MPEYQISEWYGKGNDLSCWFLISSGLYQQIYVFQYFFLTFFIQLGDFVLRIRADKGGIDVCNSQYLADSQKLTGTRHIDILFP